MEIRECTSEDLAKICEIENQSFSTPLKESTLADMMESDNARFYGAYEGTLRAFLCLERVLDEGQIVSIAVEKASRRQHIAKKLIEYAQNEKGLCILMLEVRDDNYAAKALYESCGFKAVGKRKNYYSNPVCDGVLMDLLIERNE